MNSEKSKLWSWLVYFYLFPVLISFASLHVVGFIEDLSCWSPYVCSGDSADEALYNFRNENSYILVLLIILVIVFFFVFINFYRKRRNYDIKSNFYTIIFWLFNILYVVFMIYWLIQVFTAKHILIG